jgi:hypothetical protein
VFELVPPSCNTHISSIYAQLGQPQIDFHSFWDIYNQLRDAVDTELLFRSSTGTFAEELNGVPEHNPDVAELPHSHLRPCRFGEDGVPAGEVAEYSARLEGEGSGRSGMALDITYTSAHISLDDLVVDFTDDSADEIF